jgi:hypothetical protein
MYTNIVNDKTSYLHFVFPECIIIICLGGSSDEAAGNGHMSGHNDKYILYEMSYVGTVNYVLW